jgi:hypothetical protein
MDARALPITAALIAAILGALAAPAVAAPGPTLGSQVSACAHESLGRRANPPAGTCAHDGHFHDFEVFGAMVAHMRAEQ